MDQWRFSQQADEQIEMADDERRSFLIGASESLASLLFLNLWGNSGGFASAGRLSLGKALSPRSGP